MSITIGTDHHHHRPWLAAGAVVALIAGAGLVSVAWEGATSSTSHEETPSLLASTPKQAGRPHVDRHGHIPRAAPPGTTSGGRAQVGE